MWQKRALGVKYNSNRRDKEVNWQRGTFRICKWALPKDKRNVYWSGISEWQIGKKSLEKGQHRNQQHKILKGFYNQNISLSYILDYEFQKIKKRDKMERGKNHLSQKKRRTARNENRTLHQCLISHQRKNLISKEEQSIWYPRKNYSGTIGFILQKRTKILKQKMFFFLQDNTNTEASYVVKGVIKIPEVKNYGPSSLLRSRLKKWYRASSWKLLTWEQAAVLTWEQDHFLWRKQHTCHSFSSRWNFLPLLFHI